MTGFTFAGFLAAQGIDATRSRLVRHDEHGLRQLARGRAAFDRFVATQRDDTRSPYNRTTLAFQFVPGPALEGGVQSALFICAHRVGATWIVGDLPRLPYPHQDPTDDAVGATDRAYELEAVEPLQTWSRRILVAWGSRASTRAWSQWTEANPKPIVEMRRAAEEPHFPGFASLMVRRSALLLLPPTWQAALESVRGVYLLTCPASGRQYVGSAAGADGIWGRWASYAVTGHGGNARLMRDGVQDWIMSVLELCSPLLTLPEVIDRERHWKDRLGSRAFGLNAN